jgi:hypothetical protein
VVKRKVRDMKAVWFTKDEIKEAMKCEICNKVFTEGYIVESESQEEVKRLQKRFPFVTDIHHFIFVSEECLYENFNSDIQLVTSKGVKLLRQRDKLKGEI